MLVLARGPGQSVVLDDRITVTVLASRPGLVRLGIEAPDGVGVRRGELELHDPLTRHERRRPTSPGETSPSVPDPHAAP
jgi:carbon storage regulator CsrA